MRLATVDFETYYDSAYSLSKLTTEEYVRDPRFEVIGVGVKLEGKPAVWLEEAEFRRRAAQLDWSQVAVLHHSAVFDAAILAWRYGVRPGFLLDTLSMARALHGTGANSLGKLAEKYGLGEKGDEVMKAIGKHRFDFTPSEWLRYGEYCKNDCVLTEGLFKAMRAKGFPASELRLIDMTLRQFTEPRWIGDVPLLEKCLADEQARKAALLEKCGRDKSVLMSNPKFAQLLMDLGVDPPTKISERTGEETWAFAKSDSGMQELLEHWNDDVRFAAEARIGVKSTLNETRAGRMAAVARRGPLPVQLHYYGAHTGRFSGAGKMNFQNLPRGGAMREALMAPEGYVNVAGDSGSIEARGVAWLAGHDRLVQAFREDRDVYSEAASNVYGRKIDRKKNKDDEIPGHVGKAQILGLGYSMSWEKFARVLLAGPFGAKPIQFGPAEAQAMQVDIERFTLSERKMTRVHAIPSRLDIAALTVHCAVADAIVTRWRDANDPIVALWSTMGDVIEAMAEDAPNMTIGPVVVERHKLRLPNGMALKYDGLQYSDEKGWTYMGGRAGKERTKLYGGLLTENVIQALARIVVTDQALELAKRGHKVVTTTHDEIVLCVPEADAEAVTDEMLEVMSVAPKWAAGWPVTAEAGWHKRYGKIKKRKAKR